jgi:hypothetical protein
MGKKTYAGGHTVIGPGSGWFSTQKPLEDRIREGLVRKAEDWRSQIAQVETASAAALSELHAQQNEARRLQEARKERLRAKRHAKKEAAPKAKSERRINGLKKTNPELARRVRSALPG